MLLIYTRRISTLIVGACLGFVRSLQSAESLVCVQCGSRVGVRDADGTYVFTFESPSAPPSWSQFKHVVEVTPDGKLSISCASSRSTETL